VTQISGILEQQQFHARVKAKMAGAAKSKYNPKKNTAGTTQVLTVLQQ